MKFGFVLQDGSFLPESDALKRIDDLNDTWDRGAQYAGRLEDTDREEVVRIFTREGFLLDKIQKFLKNLESGRALSPLATLYFAEPLQLSWTQELLKYLLHFDIKALLSSPGGFKTILAYLQEKKSIPASTIPSTLRRAPRKTRFLLNNRIPKGRPADILSQSLIKSFCACLVRVYRHSFSEDPKTHRTAPLTEIADLLLSSIRHNLSLSRISSLLRDQTSRK